MELISIKKAAEIHSTTIAKIQYYIKRGYITKIGRQVCSKSISEYLNSYRVNDMPNEVWKSAKGYSRYLCSNYGRIKSTKYKGGNSERIIRPAISDGYLKTVFLSDIGKYDSINIHRVICLAFYPNDNYKQLEVNHKDGNKLNNNADNLEWVTRQENIRHCVENKLQTAFKGEEVGNSKLKEFQVLEIRSKFKPRKYTRRMLSQEYNVSEATIKEVVTRITWKHI